jgi:hypothetical protein
MREEINIIFGCFTWLTVIVPAIAGWFVYDGFKGLVTMFFLALILEFFGMIGKIPLLGQIIYWFVARSLIIHYYLKLLSIEPTWLTSLIFWIGFLYTIGFSGKLLFDALLKDKLS